MQIDKIVYGFHGCTKDIRNKVLNKKAKLIESKNVYDWLGHGIYFWEYDEDRALEWAKQCHGEDASVIGAKINLKNCLDLTQMSSIDILKLGYEDLKLRTMLKGEKMPQNSNIKGNNDWVNRRLDCAVINSIHDLISRQQNHTVFPYDSVRGAFIEGTPVYSGAGFKDRTHIQLCIRNHDDCIMEYF